MSFNHPFGSWAEQGHGHSPSVFGALPYPSDPSLFTTFYFTSFNPNIHNCCVLGPQGRTHYRIVTDNHMPGYTLIKNAEGKNISLIEWQARPMIEVRGLLPKQPAKNWLGLTSDKTARTMAVRGMEYTWAPRDKSIQLFAGGRKNPHILARITRANGAITLDITPDAIQLGLLDAAVSAAFLLQCGRNID